MLSYCGCPADVLSCISWLKYYWMGTNKVLFEFSRKWGSVAFAAYARGLHEIGTDKQFSSSSERYECHISWTHLWHKSQYSTTVILICLLMEDVDFSSFWYTYNGCVMVMAINKSFLHGSLRWFILLFVVLSLFGSRYEPSKRRRSGVHAWVLNGTGNVSEFTF